MPRLPTLVHLCQRVAATNVDYITSLGDDLSYPLVKPILERCDAQQLLRLEQSSPHLQPDTPEIWKNLCYSTFPLAVERSLATTQGEPPSWKDHYFFLREAEAKRLEEASTKLRNQRLEAEERKKEREVKITDRVPPPKRAKLGWPSTTPQPKSLFQKTRSEASKLQKTMYHSRMIPPMPDGKTFRVLPKLPDASLPFSPGTTSRVTVNTVIQRRPATIAAPSTTSSTSATPFTASLSTSKAPSPSKPPPAPPNTPSSSEPRPLKPQIAQVPMKRDPMASLFLPKHRAHSQRP